MRRAPAWPRRSSGSGCGCSPTDVDDVAGHLVNPDLDPRRRGAGRPGGLPVASRPARSTPRGRCAWSPAASTSTASRSPIEGTELLARCRAARDRPPRRHPVHRPARPASAQGGDAAIREAEWAGAAARGASRSARTRHLREALTCDWSSPARPTTAVPSLARAAGLPPRGGRRLTRPDAPAGRGRALAPLPGRRRWRYERGIEVLTPAQPARPRVPGPARRARAGLLPGRRLRRAACRRAALDVPPHGWVNLHFSLLPAWRGAAPVQHAVMAGDEVTGATHLPARGGPGHRAGARHADRDGAARRHRGRPARPARRTPAPGCWSPRSTGSTTASLHAGAAAGRRRVSLAPKLERRRRAGALDRSRARASTGGCAAARRRPGAWTDVPRRAGQARPGRMRRAATGAGDGPAGRPG